MADAPPPPPPADSPRETPGDPSVPPPELLDEGALAGGGVTESEVLITEHEPEDRFRTYVAIAIALVSILGAVVAFTGTLAGQNATQLDQQGIEDTATQQQTITNLNAQVQEDVRNLAPYQEDVKAAAILQSQAAALQSSNPTESKQLQSEAESYLVLARTRTSFFQGALPQPGPSDKPVIYDAGAALQRLENNNEQLSELRPDATIKQAEDKHAQSTNLVGLVTLFIAALLFLTLAQFTRPAIRRLFAAAGGVTTLIAVVLWVLVLVLAP